MVTKIKFQSKCSSIARSKPDEEPSLSRCIDKIRLYAPRYAYTEKQNRLDQEILNFCSNRLKTIARNRYLDHVRIVLVCSHNRFCFSA
jgi:hypothetical protein